MDKIIEDKELGRLIVREHSRAKRLVFRSKSDAIYVSVPPGVSVREVEKAIEELRSKLVATKQKLTRPLIDLNYKIETEFFTLSLISGTHDKFLSHSKLGEMQVVCPSHANFTDEKLQTWLQKVIEEALRQNAKVILPPRLYLLSQQHKLPYNSVKINSSRGRWGSCSASKAINLSYFLVLLPKHLIDYVLLHELCHTREMNHGDRFWKLLNELTDGKAMALRQELKNHKAAAEGQ